MTEDRYSEEIKAKIDVLRVEHRALDAELDGGELGPLRDQLAIKRIKKRKLALKDEITRLMDQMHPDIIA